MSRHALARPNTHSRRRARAAAIVRSAPFARLVLLGLASLALAAALAAVARADSAVLDSRPPRKTTPALDARADGIRMPLAPVRVRPAAKGPDAAAVRGGAASTAPVIAKTDGPATAVAAAAVREDAKEKSAASDAKTDPRPDTRSAVALKDAKKPGAPDEGVRDVLGDLGRELRDLGRWLIDKNWE